jgi:1-acyl-sn-glycerol-3-phosphate acyltransferase
MIRAYLWTAPLIILSTVVMGTISVAGSVFDRHGRFQHSCSRLWSRFVVAVSGIHIEVRGLERFGSSRPYVICANHQSHMDIPVLLVALPFQFRFTAKKELFRIPFLGWHLRQAGHFPIDRQHPRAAVRSLERATDRIREGLPVVVFPEGGTSRSGEVGPFKRGGFLIAEQTSAWILPVTIAGTRGVLPPGSHCVRAGKVSVTIHPSLPSNSLSATELASRVRRTIVGDHDWIPSL